MKECANCGNERIMLCPFCEHDFSDQSARLRRQLAETQAAQGRQMKTIERMRLLLADLRDYGVRFDLEPTMPHQSGTHDANYQHYMRRIDRSVRSRAAEALEEPK